MNIVFKAKETGIWNGIIDSAKSEELKITFIAISESKGTVISEVYQIGARAEAAMIDDQGSIILQPISAFHYFDLNKRKLYLTADFVK